MVRPEHRLRPSNAPERAPDAGIELLLALRHRHQRTRRGQRLEDRRAVLAGNERLGLPALVGVRRVPVRAGAWPERRGRRPARHRPRRRRRERVPLQHVPAVDLGPEAPAAVPLLDQRKPAARRQRAPRAIRPRLRCHARSLHFAGRRRPERRPDGLHGEVCGRTGRRQRVREQVPPGGGVPDERELPVLIGHRPLGPAGRCQHARDTCHPVGPLPFRAVDGKRAAAGIRREQQRPRANPRGSDRPAPRRDEHGAGRPERRIQHHDRGRAAKLARFDRDAVAVWRPPRRRIDRRHVSASRDERQIVGAGRGGRRQQPLRVEHEEVPPCHPGLHHGQPASVGRQIGVHQPGVPGQAPDPARPAVQRVQVADEARAAHELELVEDDDAPPEREAGSAEAGGAALQAPVAIEPVDSRKAVRVRRREPHAAVGVHARTGYLESQRREPPRRLTRRVRARSLHRGRLRRRLELLPELAKAPAVHRPERAGGQERKPAGGRVGERDEPIAAVAGDQELVEARAVGVPSLAGGPVHEPAVHAIDGLQPARASTGIDDLAEVTGLQPPLAGLALRHDGKALDLPERQRQVGKRDPGPPEHGARDPGPSDRSIQVQHVRVLVREDVGEPVVRVADRVGSGRRHGDQFNGVPRDHRRRAVRLVVLVHEDDVGAAGRGRPERRHQRVVDALDDGREPRGGGVLVLMEVDQEVRRPERAEPEVGVVGTGQHHRRRCDEREDEQQPAGGADVSRRRPRAGAPFTARHPSSAPPAA